MGGDGERVSVNLLQQLPEEPGLVRYAGARRAAEEAFASGCPPQSSASVAVSPEVELLSP